MATTSAIVTTRDSEGNTKQKSFTDINPDATSTQIKNFTQAMIGLTNNTYLATTRVDKINCDTEDSGDSRPTATLTVTPLVTTKTGLNNFINMVRVANISYDGDGDIYVVPQVNTFAYALQARYDKTGIMAGGNADSTGNQTIDYTWLICATETENYKAPEPVEFTITNE